MNTKELTDFAIMGEENGRSYLKVIGGEIVPVCMLVTFAGIVQF